MIRWSPWVHFEVHYWDAFSVVSPAASTLTGKERRRFEQEQLIALGGKVTVHAVSSPEPQSGNETTALQSFYGNPKQKLHVTNLLGDTGLYVTQHRPICDSAHPAFLNDTAQQSSQDLYSSHKV